MKDKKFIVKKSNSGLGLFAKANFEKGDFIIEYTGEKIPNDVADLRNSKYLFALNSRFTIDGAGRENLNRYINHACKPNCEVWIEGSRLRIYAKRKIKAGEELNYDYGKEYFDEYIKPLKCRCAFCQKKITLKSRQTIC